MVNNLTIDQVSAPDFSGIAQLMTGAGASFNNAFDAAQGVLGKYQEGQQAKADVGYLNALGNVKNEKELTDFFLKNPLAKANLSPDMVKTMLAMRDTVIGYDVDRAVASNTNASADSTRASTGRETVRFQDEMAKLAADRASQPALTGAYVYGQTNGQSAPMPLSPRAVDLIGGLVARGVPEHVATGVVMNAQDESALNPAAIGDNGNAGGLFQWNGARFNGLKAFAKDQGKDWTDTDVQLDWFMVENQGSEKAAWDKVVNSGNAQDAAVNFVNEWERPAEDHRARRAAAYANTAISGGAVPGPNGYTGGGQNSYLNNPEIQAGIDAVRANKYLTVSEAQDQINQIISGAVSGQDAIKARDSETQALLADQAIIDAVKNSDFTSQNGIVGSVLGNSTLNPTTSVNAASRTNGLVAPGGDLNSIAIPGVTPNLAAQAAADQSSKNDAATVILSDVGRSSDLAESMASDPAKELMKSTGITEDSGITSTVVERELARYAKESGVSTAEFAATLKVFDDQGVALEDVLTGNVDLTMIMDAAVKAYGPDADKQQVLEVTSTAQRTSQRNATLSRIETLGVSINKMYAINKNDPGIALAQQEIQDLTQSLVAGQSPAEKIASQLTLVKPESPEFKQIAADLLFEMRKPNSGYSASDIAKYAKQLGVP